MSSFSIPLSGLSASEDALDIISNNLANLNTIGFKDQQANFQDLFYQNLGATGSGDPIEIGAGTDIGSVTSNFTNGSIQSTGIPSDVAITGDGFFVTEGANGDMQFTRAGDFTVNAQGQLITQNGMNVMGYPATDGVVQPGQGLVPLQVGTGQTSPAAATTTMQQQTNLDASAGVGGNYSTPLTVYDSLGNSHVLTFNYTNTGTNTWSYQITLPAADTGGTGNPTVVASGTLTFDSSGNLTSPSGNISGIKISGLADGAANMNMTWDLFSSTGASLLTQVASTSATSSTSQNGYASGTLQSYNVNSDGTIAGTFSNGQVQTIGQVALAGFANDQGLELTGYNTYAPTLASGQAVIGAPGSGGRGTLTGGSLEQSNVDISTEFTQLIVTQRGFEANARMVTTLDSVGSDTINLQAQPGN
jgi:flagellar hook protein FlgE